MGITAIVASVTVISNMMVCGFTVYDRVETAMLISYVMDSALMAIGINQLIMSGYFVAITFFAMLLIVAGLLILNTIVEMIFGMRVMAVTMAVTMFMSMLVVMIVV